MGWKYRVPGLGFGVERFGGLLWVVLGFYGAMFGGLGGFWVSLEGSWSRFWRLLGALGTVLVAWVALGGSCGAFGDSWVAFG